MAIKGSLNEASLPDVLQLLAMGKKSGCLSVTHRQNFGYIYFDKGRICYASIVNRRDRLGDILVKNGLITQAQLDQCVAVQNRQRDKRLGEILVERPGHRIMVDDHVVRADRRERVRLPAAAPRLAGDAGADADVADDHVVAAHVDAAADDRDPG